MEYSCLDIDYSIHIFEGAQHAGSYLKNPEKYFEIIKDFVNKVEKNNKNI